MRRALPPGQARADINFRSMNVNPKDEQLKAAQNLGNAILEFCIALRAEEELDALKARLAAALTRESTSKETGRWPGCYGRS